MAGSGRGLLEVYHVISLEILSDITKASVMLFDHRFEIWTRNHPKYNSSVVPIAGNSGEIEMQRVVIGNR